jgi:hypothetical protein
VTLLARIVLRLHPRGWRERYRDEYAALLDDHGVDARTFADVARGALDARVRELSASPPERRRRTALAACLWAAAAAAIAVAGFAKVIEYDDFRVAAARHAPVAAGRDLIFAGAGIVALAVCAGTLVVAGALWRALRGDGGSDLARPLAAAVAATAVVAAGPPLLAAFAHTASGRSPHDPRTLALVGAWLTASAVAGAAALGGAGRVLRRVPLEARELRMTIGAAWVAAAGMCVVAGGLVLWGIALATESEGVFRLHDGGLMATPTAATWAVQVVLGAGAAAFALAALRRAGGASPRPQNAPSSPPSPPPAGRSSSSG